MTNFFLDVQMGGSNLFLVVESESAELKGIFYSREYESDDEAEKTAQEFAKSLAREQKNEEKSFVVFKSVSFHSMVNVRFTEKDDISF